MSDWFEAKYYKPDDGEHIVCKNKTAKNNDWHDGIYFAEDDSVRELLVASPMPCYFSTPFHAVSYWMRIPPAPGDKK